MRNLAVGGTRIGVFAASIGMVAAAEAFTFATFSDPTIGQGNPTAMIFVAGGELSGGYDGVSLQTLSGTVTASFEVTGPGGAGGVAVTEVAPEFWALGAGAVRFFTGSDSNVLTITFESGSLTENEFGANEFQGDVVSFSGSSVVQAYTNEAFGFAFANPRVNANGKSYTASFTASVDAVPEPASLGVLGIGALALIRRRRR